jgi:hypothetical protein
MDYGKTNYKNSDPFAEDEASQEYDDNDVGQNPTPGVFSSVESSLAIGAKTVAGVGIGLLVVVAGTTLMAAASEAIIIPSLLVKLAGGIAGGGVGMAKGLSDERKQSE